MLAKIFTSALLATCFPDMLNLSRLNVKIECFSKVDNAHITTMSSILLVV